MLLLATLLSFRVFFINETGLINTFSFKSFFFSLSPSKDCLFFWTNEDGCIFVYFFCVSVHAFQTPQFEEEAVLDSAVISRRRWAYFKKRGGGGNQYFFYYLLSNIFFTKIVLQEQHFFACNPVLQVYQKKKLKHPVGNERGGGRNRNFDGFTPAIDPIRRDQNLGKEGSLERRRRNGQPFNIGAGFFFHTKCRKIDLPCLFFL